MARTDPNIRTAELLEGAARDLRDLKLAPKAKFDMTEWGYHLGTHRPTLQNHCGTSACAAGWLSLMPKWRKRGLTSHWVKTLGGGWQLKSHTRNARLPKGFRELACDVFGTEYDELANIFGAIEANRREVIKMFRELAKDYRSRAKSA